VADEAPKHNGSGERTTDNEEIGSQRLGKALFRLAHCGTMSWFGEEKSRMVAAMRRWFLNCDYA